MYSIILSRLLIFINLNRQLFFFPTNKLFLYLFVRIFWDVQFNLFFWLGLWHRTKTCTIPSFKCAHNPAKQQQAGTETESALKESTIKDLIIFVSIYTTHKRMTGTFAPSLDNQTGAMNFKTESQETTGAFASGLLLRSWTSRQPAVMTLKSIAKLPILKH